MHDEGLSVNVWTINKEKDYIRVTEELGVDMVTMNDVKNSLPTNGNFFLPYYVKF